MIAENLIGFDKIPQTIPHFCIESFRRNNKSDALAFKVDDVWNYMTGAEVVGFFDGDEVYIGSRDERPLNRYFPELEPMFAELLPRPCVVDGSSDASGTSGAWSRPTRYSGF